MNVNTSQKINAILNTVLFGVMIAINALANALPINHKTKGELSNQYPNFFVPAGILMLFGELFIYL